MLGSFQQSLEAIPNERDKQDQRWRTDLYTFSVPHNREASTRAKGKNTGKHLTRVSRICTCVWVRIVPIIVRIRIIVCILFDFHIF